MQPVTEVNIHERLGLANEIRATKCCLTLPSKANCTPAEKRSSGDLQKLTRGLDGFGNLPHRQGCLEFTENCGTENRECIIRGHALDLICSVRVFTAPSKNFLYFVGQGIPGFYFRLGGADS
jgi:hypothetical protein